MSEYPCDVKIEMLYEDIRGYGIYTVRTVIGVIVVNEEVYRCGESNYFT